MGNIDRPFGFEPYGPVIRQQLYTIPTAPTINVCIGDAVQSGGLITSTPFGYKLSIEDGSVPDGDAGLLGVITAVFDENMDIPSAKYIAPGATGNSTIAGYVMVADSPDQLYIIQEDADGNAIDLAEGGLNADLISSALCAPDSTTGLSTQEIDSSSAASSASLQLKLIRPHDDDTPADDSDVGCRWIVQINEHLYGDTIAGI